MTKHFAPLCGQPLAVLFIYSHPHQPRDANQHDWDFQFVTDRIDRMCSVWILSSDTTQRPWRSCYQKQTNQHMMLNVMNTVIPLYCITNNSFFSSQLYKTCYHGNFSPFNYCVITIDNDKYTGKLGHKQKFESHFVSTGWNSCLPAICDHLSWATGFTWPPE